MKTINKFNLTIPSKSTNESFARSAVSAFVLQLDPTIDEISDIKTAVSEAVTNCIVHAYRETIGSIYISAQIKDDRTITITVRDKGCGIDNIEQAMEPLFTTAGGERAGLGFAVMQSFMDTLRVRSKKGKGTSITMVKKISMRINGNATK